MSQTYRVRWAVIAPVVALVIGLAAAVGSLVFWLFGFSMLSGALMSVGVVGTAAVQRSQRLNAQPSGLVFRRLIGFSAVVRWQEMRSLHSARDLFGRHVEVLTVESSRLRLLNMQRLVLTHYARNWRDTEIGTQLRANRPDLFD
ncbi:MAG: hypothetical protein M3Z02_13175 [Actinomycetota bacterium]|nr:hypothetical protein [Actinomycetota bacterium]